MDKTKRYELTIQGEVYTIVSDEPASVVDKVAGMVDEMMQIISQRTGLTGNKKVAILAALKFATDLHKHELLSKEREKKVLRLAENIDQLLSC